MIVDSAGLLAMEQQAADSRPVHIQPISGHLIKSF
jgi:hypothetical protein